MKYTVMIRKKFMCVCICVLKVRFHSSFLNTSACQCKNSKVDRNQTRQKDLMNIKHFRNNLIESFHRLKAEGQVTLFRSQATKNP